MTYTIRDNNGNEIFSIENTNSEVSFESVNAEFDKLEAYSNKLNKSIEAYNLISDTRAMEALGYVKGAGFKNNVKNVGNYIWEKIKTVLEKIVSAIKTAFENLGKKITNSVNELSIKNDVIRFLKSNNMNEDFDKMDFKSKETYKKILKIYENKQLVDIIYDFVDYPDVIVSKTSNIINHVNKFDPDDYVKLMTDYFSSNKINADLFNKVKTRWKTGEELLDDYFSNEYKNDKTRVISFKVFSSKLLKFMSSDKINTKIFDEYNSKISKLGHDIETSWIPKIDKIKNDIKKYIEKLHNEENANDFTMEADNRDFELSSINIIAQSEISHISSMINTVSRTVLANERCYSAILNLLK